MEDPAAPPTQAAPPAPVPRLQEPAAISPAVITASTPKRDARKGFEVNSNNSFVQQTPSQSAAERLSEEVAALTVEAGGDKVRRSAALSSLSGAGKGSESPSSSRPQTPQRLDHPPMGVPRSSSK